MNKSTARVNSTSKSNNTITTQSSKPTTSSNATPSSTTWASKLKLPSSSTISDTSSTISSSTSTSIPPTPTHNNQTATTSTNTTTKPDQLSKQQPSKPIESTLSHHSKPHSGSSDSSNEQIPTQYTNELSTPVKFTIDITNPTDQYRCVEFQLVDGNSIQYHNLQHTIQTLLGL